MADQFDDREPIFWTNSKPGFNDRDRSNARMENGKRVVEKFPQHGHVGEYDRKEKAPGQRFVYMIRHDGFEAPICLTNAAAHLDPNSAYGQYVRMKARFLGWFGVAECPMSLMLMGRLQPQHIVARAIRLAIGHEDPREGETVDASLRKPCDHGRHNRANPCPHARLEKAARTELYNADQRERLAAYKDNGERMIEAQNAQTAAIVAAISAALEKGFNLDAAVEAVLKAKLAEKDEPPPSSPPPATPATSTRSPRPPKPDKDGE